MLIIVSFVPVAVCLRNFYTTKRDCAGQSLSVFCWVNLKKAASCAKVLDLQNFVGDAAGSMPVYFASNTTVTLAETVTSPERMPLPEEDAFIITAASSVLA